MPDIKKKDIECPKCGDFVRVRILKETIGDARWDDLNEEFMPDTKNHFNDGIECESVVTSKVIECKKCGGRWTNDELFMSAMYRGKEKREKRDAKGYYCADLDAVCPYNDDEYIYCSECVQRKADDKELERRKKEDTKVFKINGVDRELHFLDKNRKPLEGGEIWGTAAGEYLIAIYNEDKCICGNNPDFEQLEYFYMVGGLGRYDETFICCGVCFGIISQHEVHERAE